MLTDDNRQRQKNIVLAAKNHRRNRLHSFPFEKINRKFLDAAEISIQEKCSRTITSRRIVSDAKKKTTTNKNKIHRRQHTKKRLNIISVFIFKLENNTQHTCNLYLFVYHTMDTQTHARTRTIVTSCRR